MKDAALPKFTHVGTFVVVDGQACLEERGAMPGGWAVYAFRQGEEWLYFGAAEKLRSRMQGYVRRQRSAASSRIVHSELRQALARGPVEIWARAFDNPVSDHDGLPFHLPLGVEAGLIVRLRPRWNRRGKGKVAPDLPIVRDGEEPDEMPLQGWRAGAGFRSKPRPLCADARARHSSCHHCGCGAPAGRRARHVRRTPAL